tara:strand:- start:345 stop:1169 length:825 start_codon:yes stop_codon:yes gene_type:complete
MKKPIQILSLGAGVQSSMAALGFAEGFFKPMPEAAIFADTGSPEHPAEPQSVYTWLDWLEEQLPFPLYRVREKDGLLADLERGITGKRCSNPPLHTEGKDGSKGILMRTCTVDFKIRPIIRKTKELVGWTGRKPKDVRCITSIGISMDEMQRVALSREPWIEHRWPLIEARMHRHDCLKWMKDRGYPKPPRSACWFCPYHSNKEWRRLKDEEPEEFAKAIDLDRRIRKGISKTKAAALYLHKDRQPLDEVDLSTDVERGQTTLWDEECSGMCGV